MSATPALKAIEQLKKTRRILVDLTAAMPHDALVRIPDGFNNNVLWNLGHLAVTQQLLNYQLSGLPMAVSPAKAAMLRKGSSPKIWTHEPDVGEIRELLLSLPEKLAEDYGGGKFQTFKSYTTSNGIVLDSIDDAVEFNNFHEGIHTGYIMALRRAL